MSFGRDVCKEKIGGLPESPKISKNLPEFYQQELATLWILSAGIGNPIHDVHALSGHLQPAAADAAMQYKMQPCLSLPLSFPHSSRGHVPGTDTSPDLSTTQ